MGVRKTLGRRKEKGIHCDMITTKKSMKEDIGKCCAREKKSAWENVAKIM